MPALRRNGHIRTRIHVNGPTDCPVILELDKQRWRCRNCRSTLTATTPVVKPNHAISTGISEYALKLSKLAIPGKQIASITGISTTSIERIIDDDIKPHPLNYLPVNLCFDEFRSTHSTMSFICIDADTHKGSQCLVIVSQRPLRTSSRATIRASKEPASNTSVWI